MGLFVVWAFALRQQKGEKEKHPVDDVDVGPGDLAADSMAKVDLSDKDDRQEGGLEEREQEQQEEIEEEEEEEEEEEDVGKAFKVGSSCAPVFCYLGKCVLLSTDAPYHFVCCI